MAAPVPLSGWRYLQERKIVGRVVRMCYVRKRFYNSSRTRQDAGWASALADSVSYCRSGRVQKGAIWQVYAAGHRQLPRVGGGLSGIELSKQLGSCYWRYRSNAADELS